MCLCVLLWEWEGLRLFVFHFGVRWNRISLSQQYSCSAGVCCYVHKVEESSWLFGQLICCRLSERIWSHAPHSHILRCSPNRAQCRVHCAGISDWIVTVSDVAASPADVVLLKWAGVCFLGTGAGGAADTSVVRVNAESGLNHHHTVMVLVAAWRICDRREEQKPEKLRNMLQISPLKNLLNSFGSFGAYPQRLPITLNQSYGLKPFVRIKI